MLTTRHPVDFAYTTAELQALGYAKHGDMRLEVRLWQASDRLVARRLITAKAQVFELGPANCRVMRQLWVAWANLHLREQLTRPLSG